MLTAKFPLEWPNGWPETDPYDRKDGLPGGPAPLGWDQALKRLDRELRLMGATDMVLSTNQPIRQDGLPYSRRVTIHDPGAAVYFTHNGKQLVMAQDAYYYLHDNIRSLCLAIEGLRQMQRHGGGTMLERAFEGFTALPPPATGWRAVLGVSAECNDIQVAEQAYRLGAKHCHPDRGGSHDAMRAINDAWSEARRELG